jgi:abhydrolase domain-containing protein 12
MIVYKTSNLRIQSSQNQTIGAWFVLSEPAYQASGGNKRTGPPTPQEIRKSLEQYPTILFFHGNAASRAVKYRVQMYGQVTSRLRESKQSYQALFNREFGLF